MFSKSNSIKNFKDYAVLLAPNLGKPQILSFPNKRLDESSLFQVELLFIAPAIYNTERVNTQIQERIQLKPIIQLDPNTKRGIRGDAIIGQIKSVINAPIVPLGDIELVLNYSYESPRELPIKEQIYDDKTTYYSVIAEFPFTDSLKHIIEEKGYVMCDLYQSFPEEANLTRSNYHSVVLSNQTWENCTFIQATDLHIANRNDEILPILLKNYDKSLSKKLLTIKDFLSGQNVENVQDRFINPNNNLRLFITLMNRLWERKMVDAIFLTGDIIDFCIRSDGGDSITSFDMPNTNWNTFYNIILNFPITFRNDIEPINIYPSEELMVPFFTVVGNHDYRSYHYDLRWGGLHKVVNVRPLEIIHYTDVIPANPISSLYVNRKTMMGYNQYINPYQDYFVKLGDHIILMMDTGHDSASAIKDLFMGSPSAEGLSEEQYMFMRNVLKNKASSRGLRMAMFHAPNLNALPFESMNKKIQIQYKQNGLNSLEDFKEDKLKKIANGESRIDGLLVLNHGVIANNWDKTLKLLNDNKVLVLNGHTHEFHEFRTEETKEYAEIIKNKYLVLNEVVKIPVAVFMDDYSLKINSPEYFNTNLPFHLQTPSLGVGTYENTRLTGAFRIIKIKDNKLDSFRVDFISNYTKLLPDDFQK